MCARCPCPPRPSCRWKQNDPRAPGPPKSKSIGLATRTCSARLSCGPRSRVPHSEAGRRNPAWRNPASPVGATGRRRRLCLLPGHTWHTVYQHTRRRSAADLERTEVPDPAMGMVVQTAGPRWAVRSSDTGTCGVLSSREHHTGRLIRRQCPVGRQRAPTPAPRTSPGGCCRRARACSVAVADWPPFALSLSFSLFLSLSLVLSLSISFSLSFSLSLCLSLSHCLSFSFSFSVSVSRCLSLPPSLPLTLRVSPVP